MRTITYLILSLLIFGTLSAQEHDDVYFSPDDLKENASSVEYYEEDNKAYDEYADSDENYYQEDHYYSDSESYRDENGNNYITNNYYGDYYEGYDYTTKLQRYYSPYTGFDYFSPCYVRTYYGYNYSPGWSFSVGWGYSSYWGYNPYAYSSWGWNNPYSWGYTGYYGHHGYHSGYWNGYHHGYHDGYYSGFYNGYYGGNYYGNDGYSGSARGYYYGPRRSSQSIYSDNKKSSDDTHGKVNDVTGPRINTPPVNTKEIKKVENKSVTVPDKRSPNSNTKTIIKDSPSKAIQSKPSDVRTNNPGVKEDRKVIYSKPTPKESEVKPRVIEKSPQQRNYYTEPPKDNRSYEKPAEQRNINRSPEGPAQQPAQNRQPQIIEKPAPTQRQPDQNREFKEYSPPANQMQKQQPTPQKRYDNRSIQEPDRGKTHERQYTPPPSTQPKSTPSPSYNKPAPSPTPRNRGGGTINRTPKSNGPVHRPR